MRGWKEMDKYICGFDIQQEMMIAIPVSGSIIYPDVSNVRNTVPDTAKSQRTQVSKIIDWLRNNNAPEPMLNFIGATLGSQVDKMWDFKEAQLMVNHNGVFYTLKDVKIINKIENVLELKQIVR
jgi:hypothetical protein